MNAFVTNSKKRAGNEESGATDGASVSTAIAVDSVARKVREHADSWQSVRNVDNRRLHFLCWHVKLPTRSEVRGQKTAATAAAAADEAAGSACSQVGRQSGVVDTTDDVAPTVVAVCMSSTTVSVVRVASGWTFFRVSTRRWMWHFKALLCFVLLRWFAVSGGRGGHAEDRGAQRQRVSVFAPRPAPSARNGTAAAFFAKR